MASFKVATSEKWKDKTSGQIKEKTEWHLISLFGKLAEIAGEYLHKGSQVYLEGKLNTRKWQDKQGNDRYTTEVVVDGFGGQMQMLCNRQEQKQMNYHQAPQPKPQPDSQQTAPTPEGDQYNNYFDDEIPF